MGVFSRWLAAAVIAGFVAALASAPPASAEKRVALVIGNSAYSGLPKLANPESDARAIARMLADAGFDVGEARLDLGIVALQRALSELNRKAADADLAVVYFAGHGIEVDRINWLIPVDARLQTKFDVKAEAVDLDRVIEAIAPARVLRLVILDACRNDPFQRKWRVGSRDVGTRGLAQIEEPPRNTLIAYAAKAGTLAKDGKAGENSPFVKALLKHLPEPGLDIELALRRVRDDVLSATGDQEPFKYGSLGRQMVALLDAPARPPSDLLSPGSEAERVWNAIRETRNVALLETFIEQFKDKAPVYGTLARAKIEEIKGSTTVAATAPRASAAPKKLQERIEPGSQQSALTPVPGTPQAAAVAQKVVLYEEDPADPTGKRFVGSAIWRTEKSPPIPGQPPDLTIRADIEVPERKLAMTLLLRRNTDKELPASHTMEIIFKLPADFPGGGISNVPGILMKQNEQTRGTPLAGLAVKVADGFHLIGLSIAEADRERNVELLKQRAWLDIPLVYSNNRRAILAVEKGPPGERAFSEAFMAWRNSMGEAAPAWEAGGYVVQLSSQKSESEAQAAFRSLQAKFPNELGDRKLIIRRADLGSRGVYYRANVGPFVTAQEAIEFCATYKAAGGQCVVPSN